MCVYIYIYQGILLYICAVVLFWAKQTTLAGTRCEPFSASLLQAEFDDCRVVVKGLIDEYRASERRDYVEWGSESDKKQEAQAVTGGL